MELCLLLTGNLIDYAIQGPSQQNIICCPPRYCNKRVAVFSPDGKHLHDIQGDWTVAHAVVLYEPEVILLNYRNSDHINDHINSQDVLCVADREGKKIDCVGAGLKYPQFRGQVGYSYQQPVRGSHSLLSGRLLHEGRG